MRTIHEIIMDELYNRKLMYASSLDVNNVLGKTIVNISINTDPADTVQLHLEFEDGSGIDVEFDEDLVYE